MNTNMTRKLWKRATDPLRQFAAALMVVATLLMSFAPLKMQALDVQPLSDTVAAQSGYTHGAVVTWDDLNATDNGCTILQLYRIPTNSYIDRAAFYIEEAFTNSTVAATNLQFCLGTAGGAGVTNFFFTTNELDGGPVFASSGLTKWVLATNSIIALKGTTSTNYLVATFATGGGALTVDTYVTGKLRIYWRLVQPARHRL